VRRGRGRYEVDTTTDKVYSQADLGSDLEAALEEWRLTPSSEAEQQIRDICAAYGG
jgi:hypothetical protein